MSNHPPATDSRTVPEHGRRRLGRRRRAIRRTVLGVSAVVLAAVLAVGGFLWYLGTTFDQETNTIANALPVEKPARPAAAEKARNILLMGSESRNPAGGDATPDMMMLLHVPGDRKGIYAMSLMPHTVVDVPGHGRQPIDAAMALGGVSLTVEAAQNLLDVPIDHVVVVDFEGFRGLTSALGGVTLDNDAAFQSDGVNGESFAAGPITVEGESALDYVRTRHAFAGDGDGRRVRNQQAFLTGVLDGVLDRGMLTSPVKVGNVVNEISPYLSVDEDFNSKTAGTLAFSMRGIDSGDVHVFTMPSRGAGTTEDGTALVVPDPEALADIRAALAEDDLAPLAGRLPRS